MSILVPHDAPARLGTADAVLRLKTVLESINDGLLAVDVRWRIDLLNGCGAAMLGQPRESLLHRDLREVFDAVIVDAVRQVMERRQPFSFEHYSSAANRWWDYRLSPTPDGGVVAFFVDITERKQAAERALLFAQHDALTGLANRKLLREEAERILAAARRQETHFAVLFLDLDRFKPINDSHGHETGDKLLKAVAERIARTLRTEDVIGRFGGDEFVAVLVNVKDAATAAHIAGDIVETLGRPYLIDGLILEIGVSVGISVFPMHGDTLDLLFQRADAAMYSAKHDGRSRFAFHEVDVVEENPAAAGETAKSPSGATRSMRHVPAGLPIPEIQVPPDGNEAHAPTPSRARPPGSRDHFR